MGAHSLDTNTVKCGGPASGSCRAFSSNRSYAYQYRPSKLWQAHGSGHGPWEQPRPRYHHGCRWQTAHPCQPFRHCPCLFKSPSLLSTRTFLPLSLSPSHFPIMYLLTRMVPNHLTPQMLRSLWLISAFPGQVTRNKLWLSSMHLCLMALGGSTDNFENQIQKKKYKKKKPNWEYVELSKSSMWKWSQLPGTWPLFPLATLTGVIL